MFFYEHLQLVRTNFIVFSVVFVLRLEITEIVLPPVPYCTQIPYCTNILLYLFSSLFKFRKVRTILIELLKILEISVLFVLRLEIIEMVLHTGTL